MGGKLKPAILGSVLFVLAVSSGCVSEGVDKSKSDASADGAAAAAANAAPLVWRKVLAEGIEKAILAGVVSVEAGNVTLDASDSSDPDGDNLTFQWTLDGSLLSETAQSVTVALAEGNHSANLTVGDGVNVTGAGVQIVVSDVTGGGGGMPAGDAAIITQQFTGTLPAGVADAGAASVTHPFEVPSGAQQVTVSAKWNDGITGNSPIVTDIDVFLLDPSGTDLGDGAGENFAEFEFFRITDPELLPAGTYTIELLPFAVAADSEYVVDIIVWLGKPTVVEFTGNVAGVNLGQGEDELSGNGDPHVQALPADLKIVAARLEWTTADQSLASRIANDYDLYAYVAEEEMFRSGNALAWEFGFIQADEGGSLGPAAEWAFQIVSFAVPDADYTLTIEYL